MHLFKKKNMVGKWDLTTCCHRRHINKGHFSEHIVGRQGNHNYYIISFSQIDLWYKKNILKNVFGGTFANRTIYIDPLTEITLLLHARY